MKTKIILFINCCVILLLNSCCRYVPDVPDVPEPPALYINLIKFVDSTYVDNLFVYNLDDTLFRMSYNSYSGSTLKRTKFWKLSDGWYLIDWDVPKYYPYYYDAMLLNVNYDNYEDYLLNDSCFSKTLDHLIISPTGTGYHSEKTNVYEYYRLPLNNLLRALYNTYDLEDYPYFEGIDWGKDDNSIIRYNNQVSYHTAYVDFRYWREEECQDYVIKELDRYWLILQSQLMTVIDEYGSPNDSWLQ